MAFNGSGTFVRNNGTFTGSTVWSDDNDAGTNITTGNHDTHDQDLADGLTNCVTKDGQTTITANLPMSGFKHTGVADGSARNDYAALGQIQDSAVIYGTAAGTANALTLTLSPAITAYVAGMTLRVKVNTTNTGAATINVNSVGAKNIKMQDGSALIGGEMVASRIVTLSYDGTNFLLTAFEPAWTDWTPSSSASGSMTTSSDSITLAKFKHFGDSVRFVLIVKCTLGGTPDSTVNWSLPKNAVTNGLAGVAQFATGSTLVQSALATYDGSGNISFNLSDNSNYTTGANRTWYLSGEYAS